MPNPIAVRFGTSTAQKQAHEKLQALLDKAEGHNGIQGMGTLIREIVIKYLPLAEQELIPFTGCLSTPQEENQQDNDNFSSTPIVKAEEDSMIISMPDNW
jgi:hypothetical protein